MESRPPPSRPLSPLDHFRPKTKRLRIHPLETALLWIVTGHLMADAWVAGGMRWWTQMFSLGFAVLGFAVALWPRHYTDRYTDGAAFRLLTWPKLIRFPIFWLGLALFGYITVQGLNPAWTYSMEKAGWRMLGLPHITWLPTGTRSPFLVGGPWRVLIVYGTAWLTVCSVWIGFTRRKTVQFFFTTLAVNAFALGIFGIVQRTIGNGLMYWFYRSPNSSFFSSFTYKNHAGIYFNLMLALAAGLAAWFYLRGLRRLEKSNPAGLFVFFAVLIAVDIVISYARGATIVMLALLSAVMLFFFYLQARQPGLMRRPVVIALLVLGFGAFAWTGFRALSAGEAWSRMELLLDKGNPSVRSRQLATEASWDMLQANWKFGTGAGSFQFLFPIYQQHYPEIVARGREHFFWKHAHNDFMEIPAELGLFGVVIITLSFGYWLLVLIRAYFWDNPLSLIVITGLLLVTASGWFDFPFENPAILLTWCALWPAVALWTQYEERNLRG